MVGAGFAGAVVARQLAAAGLRVLLVEQREHVGGNAYDELDDHGILVHRYGPHLFHTQSERIFGYLSCFTAWRPYEHRVLARVAGRLLPLPINRTTINQLYGWDLDEQGMIAFLAQVAEVRPMCTSEDVVLSRVGAELCELFFRHYTKKQWGLELSQLAPQVAGRIPVRTNDDDRYFTDSFQAIPRNGYTAMFRNMLDHPLIQVELATPFAALGDCSRFRHVVYTGPVDAYYGYRFGALPYRSLRFVHRHLPDTPQYQPVATVNDPGPDVPWTRTTEFKHITGEQHPGTSIVIEYPEAQGDPYYPIPNPSNEALYQRYKQLAHQEAGVTFVGRLAQYRYYNMDQVVGAALAAAQRIKDGLL